MKHNITSILTLSLLTLPALAQPADTLRGPAVPSDAVETIGTTDMNGRFTPVEGRPELAAFIIVCDDPEDLARARELGSAHTFELAEMLIDEIDTVREITDAIASGNGVYAQTLLAGIRKAHDPDLVRDPLSPKLQEMLTPDQRTRFKAIIDDYWHRWVRAETPIDQQNMQGEPNNQAVYQRIENKLSNQLFQQDIANAYEYSLRRYRDALQAMYDAIEPTPKQRAWIRDRVITHIKQTRLRATAEQREAVMLEIYTMLDDERKAKLFGYMTRAALNSQ